MPGFISDEEMASLEAKERPKKFISDDEMAQMSKAEEEGNVVTGVKKAIQGASLGFSDELSGGLEALGSKFGYRGLGGPMEDIRSETPEEKDQSFGDVYRQGRDLERRRQTGQAAAYPKTSALAEFGGNLATSALLPGGAVANGALTTGLMGLGDSTADVTKGEVGKAALDAGVGAGIGGAAAGAFKGLGALADKTGVTDLADRAIGQPLQKGYDYVTQNIPAKLKDFAEERAAKAALGQNRAAITNLENTDLGGGRTGLNKMGRDLLSKDEYGDPLVGWFSRSEGIAPAAKARAKSFGKDIGEVGRITEELTPGSVSGADIAEGARQFANEKLPQNPLNDSVRNRVEGFANAYKDKTLPWQEAQNLKSSLPWKATNPGSVELGKEGSNALYSSVANAMDNAAKRATESPDVTPEQLQKLQMYDYLKGKFGSFKEAAKDAKKRESGNISNRFFSPSDMLLGGGLGTAGAYANRDDPAKAAILGLGSLGAARFARTRGSAFAAHASDAVANFLQSGGKLAAEYGPVIQKTLQEQGPEAAAIALYVLSKKDPSNTQGGAP
jgi:hypothetical protein